MEIRIGTSGYSFEDWRGNFYPAQIEKGKMLDHYQAYFNTVEINSTYYRIPHQAVIFNMVKKTRPEFEFLIKANQSLTHQRKEIEEPTQEFMEVIRPMVDRGQLKGILAQFPWSFKCSRANLDYLGICRELTRPHPLFVEFRNDSWMSKLTYEFMKEKGIGYVSVDGPRLRGLLPPELITIGDTAYIRLHGRNAEQWWGGGNLRYDYLYNETELQEWKEKLDRLKGDAKKAFIFFNNCHLGQAVKNARQMMRMLAL